MMRLCEILGVEEGLIFKIIGLKDRYPDDLYMIIDNQLFYLENLSSSMSLDKMFLHEVELDEIIVKPMYVLDGEVGCNCDDSENRVIGFAVDTETDGIQEESEFDDEDYDDDDIDTTKVMNGNKSNNNFNDDAINYLNTVNKYSNYKYITKDPYDGSVVLHESEPYLDNEKGYWHSKDKVNLVDIQDLFSNIPSDIYLSISDIIQCHI